ncbi:MAG: response regulator transcription factor [Candidatus Eremiobacteraeota bacterium]|nr:response regulator transcription factor [Candidatus Eremiobacteraeota bacterium]
MQQTVWKRAKPRLALLGGEPGARNEVAPALALDFELCAFEGARPPQALLLFGTPATFREALLDLRARSDVPALLILDEAGPADRIDALEHGADDVLVQPVDAPELMARLRAVIRRVVRPAPSVLRAGDIEINLDSSSVRRGAREVALSPTEFSLLTVLARSNGAVVPRARLIDEVWGSERQASATTVHTFVSYLRAKLGDAGTAPVVRTVRGVGYALNVG